MAAYIDEGNGDEPAELGPTYKELAATAEAAVRELGALRGAVGDYLAALDETASRKSPRRSNALERLRKVYGGGAS